VRAAFAQASAEIWSEAPRLSAAAYLQENRRFHEAIMQAGGNRQLCQLHQKLQLALIMAQISGALTPEILAASMAEHRAIARAILTADGPAAERALRQHLHRATTLMRSMPRRRFRPERD
jgi:DNA-binding FadR family transcriptional regulator